MVYQEGERAAETSCKKECRQREQKETLKHPKLPGGTEAGEKEVIDEGSRAVQWGREGAGQRSKIIKKTHSNFDYIFDDFFEVILYFLKYLISYHSLSLSFRLSLHI